ncbi:MAG: anthranilate synthase component I [Chloroflexi bacterium]|nr:anthranilate synthase component I [Chloroflexota bacterium]
MVFPDLDTFKGLAERGNIVPVWRELPADLDTPVSVYLKLRKDGPSFLLESVEGGEKLGRYSFIGSVSEPALQSYGDVARLSNGHGPVEMTLRGSDPLHLLKQLLANRRVAGAEQLPKFFGGAVGYIGYDTVRFFEKVPAVERDELNVPDCVFLLADNIIIFDHVRHTMKVVCNAHVDGDVESAYRDAVHRIDEEIAELARPYFQEAHSSATRDRELASNFTLEEFSRRVEAAKEYIAAGDSFQIVLSQRFRRRTSATSFQIYRALRMLNPSPYMYYLDLGDFQLVGSSPEVLVKAENGRAYTRPLAGTRRRGSDDAEDQALIADLLADPKERAEHVMLVDLARNDLGRVCRYGTVNVPLLMGVEKYSHVIHIVSSVEGELRQDRDAFDLLRASFPAGTLSGAPKVRAMEIIAELEGIRRGPYGGAVGYFGYSGNMDTCITIRTIVMKGDTVYLQAGAGIVADSEPVREYQETLSKIKALELAVKLAEENGFASPVAEGIR